MTAIPVTDERVDRSTSLSSKYYYLLTAFLCALVPLVCWETTRSMVAIWDRSGTFTHGYLIGPIAIWLFWRQRTALNAVDPAPFYPGLLLLALVGFGGVLGDIGDVQVVSQLAMVSMIPLLCLSLLGLSFIRAFWFPLFYLIFLVPIGEGLIPVLMDFTAAFTVHLLQLTGIPVFWEGTFFSIPSGNWSVVEGCSGVRYLIASVALGFLYTYITFKSTTKRFIFAALFVVVPIIANGLRAYMIVMIAHLSNMKLALGVDHLIYGWVFFGLVMFLIFLVGARFSDEEPDDGRDKSLQFGFIDRGRAMMGLVGGLVVVLSWPVMIGVIEGKASAQHQTGSIYSLPADWQLLDSAVTSWKPDYKAMDKEQLNFYRQGSEQYAVYLADYFNRPGGGELINSQNFLVPQKHPNWRQTRRYSVTVQNIGGLQQVTQAEIDSPKQKLLVWQWYQIGNSNTTNPYEAKLLDVVNRVLLRSEISTGIVIYSPYEGDIDVARKRLETLAQQLVPALSIH